MLGYLCGGLGVCVCGGVCVVGFRCMWWGERVCVWWAVCICGGLCVVRFRCMWWGECVCVCGGVVCACVCGGVGGMCGGGCPCLFLALQGVWNIEERKGKGACESFLS